MPYKLQKFHITISSRLYAQKLRILTILFVAFQFHPNRWLAHAFSNIDSIIRNSMRRIKLSMRELNAKNPLHPLLLYQAIEIC